MKVIFDGQLRTTSLMVTYKDKSLQINDVVIDTGSSHTVFTPDLLEKIEVYYENGDPIYEAYGIGGSIPFYTKVVNKIQIGQFEVNDIEIDVGTLPKNHSGLLGLDILKTYNFIIDMEKLDLYNDMERIY